MTETKSRIKVLLFAEGATLAHVARPFVVANLLDAEQFEVTLARPASFQWLTAAAQFRVVDLDCQDGAVFAHRLEHLEPLYDYSTLKHYVDDDLALIDAEQPDVIIGDFRLSLSVSARVRSVPYITICDAYWSPDQPFRPPVPVLGFTRFTPIPLAQFLFSCLSGVAAKRHTAPLGRLREDYGLPSLGQDIRRCYTDADLRLYANFPELFPEVKPSSEADFLGPIAWSPEPTSKLDFLDSEEPLIYVTMGSSGDPRVLDTLVPILERTGHRVILASAGRFPSAKFASARTLVFDYLPGDQVCQHAKLVVCNGGSPTTNQALRNGVPVLGIAQNMDQLLNMRAVERFGAGILVRGDRTHKHRLQDATSILLTNTLYGESARMLACSALQPHFGTKLTASIDRLLSADEPLRAA